MRYETLEYLIDQAARAQGSTNQVADLLDAARAEIAEAHADKMRWVENCRVLQRRIDDATARGIVV